MSRNTQYQFISTDTNALVSALVSGYEKITGVSVQPASPEKGSFGQRAGQIQHHRGEFLARSSPGR